MELKGMRILLTGAESGVGRSLAFRLAEKGAVLGLAGKNEAQLVDLAMEIRAGGGSAFPFVFDHDAASGQGRLILDVMQHLGAINVLINNTDISGDCEFSTRQADEIERLFKANILGPILLTRAVLPLFARKNSGSIVNIGSALGWAGSGGFAVHSAAQFALRGFSEALGRELDHTKIRVTHVARRGAVDRHAHAGVARTIVRAIERERSGCVMGWPEKVTASLSALFSGIADIFPRKAGGTGKLAGMPASKTGNVRYYADFRKRLK